MIEKGTHLRVKLIGTRSDVGSMFAIGSIKEDFLGFERLHSLTSNIADILVGRCEGAFDLTYPVGDYATRSENHCHHCSSWEFDEKPYLSGRQWRNHRRKIRMRSWIRQAESCNQRRSSGAVRVIWGVAVQAPYETVSTRKQSSIRGDGFQRLTCLVFQFVCGF